MDIFAKIKISKSSLFSKKGCGDRSRACPCPILCTATLGIFVAEDLSARFPISMGGVWGEHTFKNGSFAKVK